VAPSRPPPRGFSILELMIAMAVIAFGLLAMWRLHVIGITSTAAARRHTIATAVARELVTGLERLSFSDTLLSDNGCIGRGTEAGPPPECAVFGQLVDWNGSIRSGAHEWSDGNRVPGVRLDTEMPEKADAAAGYERRWTVWTVLSPAAAVGSPTGTKLIAASVIWRDPPFGTPREVVLYSQVANPNAVIAGMVNSQ
jgi:prepilin-type N-terminal cleavage/methylation domain-containing protein